MWYFDPLSERRQPATVAGVDSQRQTVEVEAGQEAGYLFTVLIRVPLHSVSYRKPKKGACHEG